MKRRMWVLWLGVSAGAAPAALGSPPGPPSPSPAADLAALLSRVAEHDARVEETMDRADFTQAQAHWEVDAAGRELHRVERTVRFTHAQGQERQALAQAREDGRDTTEALRPRFEEAQGHYLEARAAAKRAPRESWLPFADPFGRTERGRYRFLLLGEVAGQPGRVRIHFEPKLWDDSTSLYVGEAVVDARTGAPTEVSLQPAKLPLLVQRMATRVRFQETPLGPALEEVSSQYDSGPFFARKRVRETKRFGGFSGPATSAGRP